MDFICILPYMRMGGVVVLHDTQASVACSGNLKSPKVGLTGPWRCCCTQILFACTKGKKYINFNSPNIAAIEVGIETWNNIYDAVWALGMTWGEMPDKETLDKYMEIFSKKYDKQCNDLFHRAVSNNRLIHNNLQIYGIRKGEVLENFSHVFIG